MKKQLDIKKLLLLNLPYILMGLFATNFGEAWRMAVGADASAKMLSFFSTLPVALASWWPSLHPLDLLMGLCCGAGLRLAVYLKSKNAKKYRHGMEYGSARWGTHEDIAPYIDPVFQNNVILTKTESLTMNSRPKDPKTARNKNVLVIGGSGSGKTRFWLKPNLMQMHSSYVVTDPKGTILVECGKMLQRGTPKLGKDGKGRTVKQPGWRALDAAYRAGLKNVEPETEDKALPELSEGQTLPLSGAAVKEGKTTPPKHFTEDTLLSAMETAGKDDMPEDAERKGLGTPATRAGILEKLVATGFLERKKSKKQVQLLPSHDAVSLITVLPEQLQSPLLTAEWEYRLGEIERGELAPEDFMDGISTMLKELVGTYQMIKGTEYLFTPPREMVGKCPRCGGDVAELQKGFFCQNEGCKFAIWKNNKWWELKRKQPTKAIVTALLKNGRAHVSGLYSEKTGKTYDATVVLEDDGQYANFKLEFERQKGGGK